MENHPNNNIPPGQPGISPKWTSSAKIGVGTALTGNSVWFAISHGIINEVYYPRIDLANTRDFGLIVTDGKEFFSEEKRHAVHEYATVHDGVPAHILTNTCLKGKYRIIKTVITDPLRNVLLQKVKFEPLQGKLEDYHLYALLSPHVQNAGSNNNGWACGYKGMPMLFAERSGVTLAVACTHPFKAMSCGYVGISDGWQDLKSNKKLTHLYPSAVDGNLGLTAEIDLMKCDGEFVLALGFGNNADEAGLHCRAALFRPFEHALEEYVKGWSDVHNKCSALVHVDTEASKIYRTSIAVIKTHNGKEFLGSSIASLSIPWGSDKGDNDLGGYHLIWPRDQVNTGWSYLAANDIKSARDTMFYLMCTQEVDGHWLQCMWADGTAYWKGVQLDETALPILLADSLRRVDGYQGLEPLGMVEKAIGFIVRNGPSTHQDRWEENSGYTPYTIATTVAALLAGADFFEEAGKKNQANYLRETADCWNDSIETWLYAQNTEVSKRVGVDGYYVRNLPNEAIGNSDSKCSLVLVKNRLPEESLIRAVDLVSVDALALVRFGLRAADDPRILNTVSVIDAYLRTQTAKGPVWHRYNYDGYGEHADGSSYDGVGIGRGWPLLTGERGHYELACGNKESAQRLLRVMARQAGEGGLIPEQLWDAEDIPEKSLFNGHSTGAAKPLVWAHAEYINLLRSVKEGEIFNMPPQTKQRYIVEKRKSPLTLWRFDHRPFTIPAGKMLRIETLHSARVRWTTDEWKTVHDSETVSSELGIYYVDLPVHRAPDGTRVKFTFFWLESHKWEGIDFETQINASFQGFLV